MASTTIGIALFPSFKIVLTTLSNDDLVLPATNTSKLLFAIFLHNCPPKPFNGPTPMTKAFFICYTLINLSKNLLFAAKN